MMTLAGVFLGLIVIGLAIQLLGKVAGDDGSASFGRFLAGCGLQGCGCLGGVVVLGVLAVAAGLYWLFHDSGRSTQVPRARQENRTSTPEPEPAPPVEMSYCAFRNCDAIPRQDCRSPGNYGKRDTCELEQACIVNGGDCVRPGSCRPGAELDYACRGNKVCCPYLDR